jgi:thymidylate synthase
MKQYHEHLEAILKYGTKKEPAREGMPGSISLFGYQNRYNLQEGFPILTTKEVNFKNIVVELLWFLKGDTNIKYLVDNGCNIWNEDSYNYYLKQFKGGLTPMSFEQFVDRIKNPKGESRVEGSNYSLGDCGKQYGWLWRNWSKVNIEGYKDINPIDQIQNLIQGLKSNPLIRRHIITAWNPATLDDMALNACHAFVQFNCRELDEEDRLNIYNNNIESGKEHEYLSHNDLDKFNIPKYYLDCQLYQRSADMFLGVPYNISSYALLTEIIAKICNMIPGEFIHTFGDSHIYDNHLDQVNELLTRDPEKYELPKLIWNTEAAFENPVEFTDFIENVEPSDFTLVNYQSYPAIKAKLSTGLK